MGRKGIFGPGHISHKPLEKLNFEFSAGEKICEKEVMRGDH